MGHTNYRVVLTGDTIENTDRQDVIITAAKIFNCTEEKASRLLSGKPTPLKKEMDESTATRYRDRLIQAGIACRIEAIKSVLTVAEKLASNLSLEPKDGEQTSEVPAQEEGAAGETHFHCPKCHTAQQKGIECIKCGIVFAKYQPPQEPVHVQAEVKDNGTSDEWDEICLFIGENTDAYRHKLRALYDNDGKYKLQWHWPAFFIPIPWMIFRKMYLWAVAYTLIMAVSPLILLLPVVLLPGLAANYLYYRTAVQKIAKITSRDEQRRAEIAQAGGSNSIIMTIGLSVLATIIMSFIMYKLIFASYVEQAMESVKQDANFMQDDKNSGMQNPGIQTTKFQMLMLKNAVLMQKRLMASEDNAGSVPTNMEDLLDSLHHESGADLDAWKTPMQFEYDNGKMTFVSAGPDKIFGNDDDIVLETEE